MTQLPDDAAPPPSASLGNESPLGAAARHAVEEYFRHLDGEAPEDLHNFFVNLIEKPLLEVVLVQARGNQSVAATWLGLNRNTLKRKMDQFDLNAKALWHQAVHPKG